MGTLDPNKLTVGEACEQFARLSCAEARSFARELSRLGIVMSPVASYSGNEWNELLQRGQVFGGGGNIAGNVAGQTASVLVNPVTSGVKALLFYAHSELTIATDALLLYAFDAAIWAGSIATQKQQALKLRTAAASVSQCLWGLDTTIADIGAVDDFIADQRNGSMTHSPGDGICMELQPGRACAIATNALNKAMVSAMWWAEIPVAQIG